MSGTWPGFSADWEESSEYQEARSRARLKRQGERLVARGQTGNADQLSLDVAITTEGEVMEPSGYGFEDAESVEEVLSLALDATPDDVDHMISRAATAIRNLSLPRFSR
jgi:hypothetical protein